MDDHGCIDLSGVLKVTAGYGKNGMPSILRVLKNGIPIEKENKNFKILILLCIMT